MVYRMKKLTVELTSEELGVLTTMASDQLFRKQFIDPKMPGYRTDAEELDLCKQVVAKLKLLIDSRKPISETKMRVEQPKVKRAGSRY